MKTGLVALLGAGAGFIVGGPLGAVVGGLAGYVGSKVWDAEHPVRTANGWSVVPTADVTPPGLLDSWTSQAKSGAIRVGFALRKASNTLVAKGAIVNVGVEDSGRRFWSVDPSEYQGFGSGDVPPIDVLWKLYDNELVQLPPGT